MRGLTQGGVAEPPDDFGLGAFFFEKGVSGHFFGASIEGLLGLLRLSGRESESIGPVHQIWLGGGLGGPETAPLGLAKKKCKNGFGLKLLFRRSALCSLEAACGQNIIRLSPGGQKSSEHPPK